MSETLFDMTPPPQGPQSSGVPHNRTDTSAKAARAFRPEATAIQAMVLGSLASAGPEGMTLPEITEAVSRKRGIHTKETSITGRLDTLSGYRKRDDGTRYVEEDQRWIYKTKLRRQSATGYNVAVWVHKMHWTESMGDDKAQLLGADNAA